MEETASYTDFVEKMPANSILLCASISNFMPTPYPEGYLLTVICYHSRDAKFITFQAIKGDSGADEIYTARYAEWANEKWRGWRKTLSTKDFSNIPYLYNYFTAKQPLFLISENSQDTIYCNGRGCRRNSSAKALIFKVMSSLADGLKGNNVSTGYGIISYSDDDAGCTALTDYGEISISHRRTPKGHDISFGYMANRWIYETGLPVTATINGEAHTLESCVIYLGELESYVFIFSMADLYLF